MTQKSIFLVVLFSLFLGGCQHAQVESQKSLTSEDSNGSFVESFSAAQVILIPQWHLGSQDDTKKNPRLHLPQSANQIAIYRQVTEWVQEGQLQTVIVEGCEGEITSASPLKFNGWTVQDLASLSEKDLDTTITQVGLKLKARLGDKLRVVCGDNQALIEKHLLVLSDLRGLLGFKLRIAQLKAEPEKRKDYVATVRELLKLRPETEDQQVIEALDQELQGKLDAYENLVKERNAFFLNAIRAEAKRGRVAVVIGSLHVPDLQSRARASGQSIAVFKPVGMQGGEEDLINQVRTLLKKIDG